MKNILVLFPSVVLITVIIQTGESTKCFFCHSSKDLDCQERIRRNEAEIVECTAPETSCLRFDFIEADGFKTSDRRCIEARTDPCGMRAKIIEYLLGKIEVCQVCDEDYCNGLNENHKL